MPVVPQLCPLRYGVPLLALLCTTHRRGLVTPSLPAMPCHRLFKECLRALVEILEGIVVSQPLHRADAVDILMFGFMVEPPQQVSAGCGVRGGWSTLAGVGPPAATRCRCLPVVHLILLCRCSLLGACVTLGCDSDRARRLHQRRAQGHLGRSHPRHATRVRQQPEPPPPPSLLVPAAPPHPPHQHRLTRVCHRVGPVRLTGCQAPCSSSPPSSPPRLTGRSSGTSCRSC